MSKVRVLQKAIDYICNMRDMIRAFDGDDGGQVVGNQDQFF